MEKKKPKQNSTKRPSKKSRQAMFLNMYLEYRGHIGRICKEIGIDRATYYLWIKEPKFAQDLGNLIEFINDSVEGKILEEIDAGDRELIKLWAKTKMKHRGFVERTEVHNTGNVEISVEELNKAKEHIKKLVKDADNS